MSGASSTTIRSGENLLLTFRNVRNVAGENNDVFDQATLAALDMSAALGRDLTSASKTVGKALQNPIRGVSGLRRANVSFSKAQETTIQRLVESGRMLEAQKIILRQVEVAYGGSAAAAGDTFAGKVNRLRNSLLELGVTVGTELLPVVTPLVEQMTAWLEKPKNKKKVVEGTTSAVGGLARGFETLGDAIGGVNALEKKTDDFFRKIGLGFLAEPPIKWFDKDGEPSSVRAAAGDSRPDQKGGPGRSRTGRGRSRRCRPRCGSC